MSSLEHQDPVSFFWSDDNLVGLVTRYLEPRDVLSLSHTCKEKRASFPHAFCILAREAFICLDGLQTAHDFFRKFGKEPLEKILDAPKDAPELLDETVEEIVRNMEVGHLNSLIERGLLKVKNRKLFASNDERIFVCQCYFVHSENKVGLLREFINNKVKFNHKRCSNCDYYIVELDNLFRDLCEDLLLNP